MLRCNLFQQKWGQQMNNKKKKKNYFNIQRDSALEIDEENAAYHKRSSSKYYFSHILLQTASKFKEKKKQQKESIIFFFDNFQLMNEKRRLRAEIRKELKRHSHFGSLLIPRRDTFCSLRAQLTHRHLNMTPK